MVWGVSASADSCLCVREVLEGAKLKLNTQAKARKTKHGAGGIEVRSDREWCDCRILMGSRRLAGCSQLPWYTPPTKQLQRHKVTKQQRTRGREHRVNPTAADGRHTFYTLNYRRVCKWMQRERHFRTESGVLDRNSTYYLTSLRLELLAWFKITPN